MRYDCGLCEKRGWVYMKCKDLGGRQYGESYVEHIVTCPSCLGKGYRDKSDDERVQSVEQYYQIV